MAENSFSDSVKSLLSGLDGFLSTKTIVGEPIQVNETVVVPLMEVQVGIGAGAYAGSKSNGSTAGGMGAKMIPNSVLLLQDGHVRLVNIKNQDAMTKILDLIPEVVDRASGKKLKKDPKVDEVIEEIKKETDPE